jgi:hypothetical protein
MNLFEQLVLAAANRESLMLRELTLEFLAQNSTLEQIPQPNFSDPVQLAIAAGLLELFATRRSQAAPDWVKNFSSPTPFFLVAAALRMPRLRELCETQAPPELLKRSLFAPPNFLEFA